MADKLTKTAVDAKAKEYWKLLWETYGEALTRDIPRRLKAALVNSKKVASVDEQAIVLPVAHAKSGESTLVEGIYKDKSTKLMFHAVLSKDGDVVEVKSFDLR